MTSDELTQMVKNAVAQYDALSPEQKAFHDHEQRRSFVRGMCSSRQDYTKWCKLVDELIPPMRHP